MRVNAGEVGRSRDGGCGMGGGRWRVWVRVMDLAERVSHGKVMGGVVCGSVGVWTPRTRAMKICVVRRLQDVDLMKGPALGGGGGGWGPWRLRHESFW